MRQKGSAHIFLILLLLVGLAVAVYLVQQKTNILPKAYDASLASKAPTNLNRVCDPNTHSVKLTWDPADDVTNWYVRYRKSKDNWWPKAGSEVDALREQVESKRSAVNKENYFLVYLEPDQKSLDIWGVYACSGQGDETSCSNFVKGEPVECEAVSVTPTQTPIPTLMLTPTLVPTSTFIPTPTSAPVFTSEFSSFGYTCGTSTAETIGAKISWEPSDETHTKFLYGWGSGPIDAAAVKYGVASTQLFVTASKSMTHYVKRGQLFHAELALADSGNNRISKFFTLEFKCPKSN